MGHMKLKHRASSAQPYETVARLNLGLSNEVVTPCHPLPTPG